MSATVIQFPDAIRIPPRPPGAVIVRDDRPSLGDLAATQRAATLIRWAGAEMPLDHQCTAATWLSEAVKALGEKDMPDAMRCFDMAARAWKGEI
jgi:hypothetical protein